MSKISKKLNKNLKALLPVLLFALFSLSFAHGVLADEISADKVVQLVNAARQEAQMPQLQVNFMLQDAAERKAQDMIDYDYFAHVSPSGKSPWVFITEQGYDYRYAGENLAINFTNAMDQQNAWMESPLHRKNILNPNYSEIGVAVKTGVIDGHKSIITVQEFGTQMSKDPSLVLNSNQTFQDTKKVAGVSAAAGPRHAILTINNLRETDTIFKEGSFTILGWFAVLIIGAAMVAADFIILFVKKRRVLKSCAQQ